MQFMLRLGRDLGILVGVAWAYLEVGLNGWDGSSLL